LSDPSAVLAALGWDDRLTALWAAAPDHLVPGRVTRVDRGRCTVSTPTGDHRPHTPDPVAVGDWVAIDPHRDRVDHVLPRTGALTRRAPGEDTAAVVLAANLDLVLVTHPADRGVNRRRLERELVVAWDSGARPVVVLTKADRCGDVAAALTDAESVSVGADVLAVSAHTGEGLHTVRALLRPGRTLVLLGKSGAGKSTLLNALAGAVVQEVQDVRDADGRGRHTTSAGRLVTLPGGALLVDTPGIRSVGLWDGEGLQQAFADIDELATGCRFADCGHQHEPGCAVRGVVPDDRIAAWHKLQREAARTSADRAGWQKAQENRQRRAWGRAVRSHTYRP
jgi:ribosome small subunit-dependent GTPase A